MLATLLDEVLAVWDLGLRGAGKKMVALSHKILLSDIRDCGVAVLHKAGSLAVHQNDVLIID